MSWILCRKTSNTHRALTTSTVFVYTWLLCGCTTIPTAMLLCMPVPDLPVCFGVLKHRAPLARGGGSSCQKNIRWIFAYVVQFLFYNSLSFNILAIPQLPEHVIAYRIYPLQGPSKGPHNLTSTGPHLSLVRHWWMRPVTFFCKRPLMQADVHAVVFMNELKDLTNVVTGKLDFYFYFIAYKCGHFTHGFVYHISWRQTKFFIAFINILWVSTVFSTPYLFLDTAARLQWPVTHFSTFYQFFLLSVV